MKTPCPVKKAASPVCRHGEEQGVFSRLPFPHSILGGWRCLGSREGAPRQAGLQAGGFALCWMKPDLLQAFCSWIFRICQMGRLLLESSSSQTSVFKLIVLL